MPGSGSRTEMVSQFLSGAICALQRYVLMLGVHFVSFITPWQCAERLNSAGGEKSPEP